MYVTSRSRIEYGIRWTRHRNGKGQRCWRSPKQFGLTITLEPVRIPTYSGGSFIIHRWAAQQGKSYFFTTSRLRRAFQIAARHARWSVATEGFR